MTLYASELDADTEQVDTTSNSGDDSDEESYRGYVIRFSDGQMIPDEDETTHTTQEQNMGPQSTTSSESMI